MSFGDDSCHVRSLSSSPLTVVKADRELELFILIGNCCRRLGAAASRRSLAAACLLSIIRTRTRIATIRFSRHLQPYFLFMRLPLVPRELSKIIAPLVDKSRRPTEDGRVRTVQTDCALSSTLIASLNSNLTFSHRFGLTSNAKVFSRLLPHLRFFLLFTSQSRNVQLLAPVADSSFFVATAAETRARHRCRASSGGMRAAVGSGGVRRRGFMAPTAQR